MGIRFKFERWPVLIQTVEAMTMAWNEAIQLVEAVGKYKSGGSSGKKNKGDKKKYNSSNKTKPAAHNSSNETEPAAQHEEGHSPRHNSSNETEPAAHNLTRAHRPAYTSEMSRRSFRKIFNPMGSLLSKLPSMGKSKKKETEPKFASERELVALELQF